MGVFASRIMRLGPNADPVLNNNEWDVISDVASLSKGANYWAVGDCKEITLDGTVGALTLSNYTWRRGREKGGYTSSLQRRPSPAVRIFASPTGSTSILAPRRRSA